jgi:hypothetical protein
MFFRGADQHGIAHFPIGAQSRRPKGNGRALPELRVNLRARCTERTTPVRGVTGVAGVGSGGVEPTPLSGYGGCNRRGLASMSSKRHHVRFFIWLDGYPPLCLIYKHARLGDMRRAAAAATRRENHRIG